MSSPQVEVDPVRELAIIISIHSTKDDVLREARKHCNEKLRSLFEKWAKIWIQHINDQRAGAKRLFSLQDELLTCVGDQDQNLSPTEKHFWEKLQEYFVEALRWMKKLPDLEMYPRFDCWLEAKERVMIEWFASLKIDDFKRMKKYGGGA